MKKSTSQKSSRSCIFCGSRDITREHIWPDWLKRHVTRLSTHRLHSTSRYTGHGYEHEQSKRPGDPRAWRLRVTCRKCNGGWINHIDDDAKEVILPLKDGKWGCFLQAERLVLARWATRFTMVFEFAHPATIVATQAEREHFRDHKIPPQGWTVYLGYYGGVKWKEQWHHRAAVNLTLLGTEKPIPGVIYLPNIQSTIFVLGNMVLNVVSGPTRVLPSDYAASFGLHIVWPDSFPPFGSTRMILGDDTLDAMVSFFGGPSTA